MTLLSLRFSYGRCPLPSILLGAGRTSGGGSRGVDEWVLAPNESYLFQITSAGGGGSTCNAFIGLVWYEHTDSI